MPQIILTTRDGEQHTLNAHAGHNVMEVIRDAGVDELMALCGGCCSCATCHVYIGATFVDRLPAMADDEDALLDSSKFRTVLSRLSCQVIIDDGLDGLEITVAPAD